MAGIYIHGLELPIHENETILRIHSDGSVLDQYGHHLYMKAIPVLSPGRASHLIEVAPTTNYDLLVSKTPDELACWIAQILMHCVNRVQLGKTDCLKNCPLYKCCNNCPTASIEEWLLSPADKETKEK